MATTLGQDQQGHTVQVQHGVELAGQIVSCVLEGNDESMRRPGDARECSVSCCVSLAAAPYGALLSLHCGSILAYSYTYAMPKFETQTYGSDARCAR